MAIDKLWAMKVFVQVAESLSFTHAARILDIATSNASNRVRALESYLGTDLFDRSKRSLRMTEQGALYLAHCRRLLDMVSDAGGSLSAGPEECRNSIHIEVPVAIGRKLFCPLVSRLVQEHPGVQVRVTLSNQHSDMVEREIDIALRFGGGTDARQAPHARFGVRYILCCAPGLVTRLPAHPADLDARLCLGMLPEGRFVPNAWPLQRGADKARIQPQGPLHFNNTDDLLAAARSGLGLVCVREWVARQMLSEGSLCRVYADWDAGSETLQVLVPQAHRATPPVASFLGLLPEVLGEIH